MNKHSIKEIFTSAQNGNLFAFNELLFLYEKEIFGYIYRLVRQKQDSEDLTQEIFIKVYKNIKSVESEKNFRAWLYKIATNTVYDFWRKKMGKVEISFDKLETFAFTNNEQNHGLETNYAYLPSVNMDSAREVEMALANIKPIYKAVLLLFYKEDLSYKEIAKILEKPINTVKTYIRRAKKALKDELEK
jgi:RNA polymerase sigma-70 factor (ECF subfamily)